MAKNPVSKDGDKKPVKHRAGGRRRYYGTQAEVEERERGRAEYRRLRTLLIPELEALAMDRKLKAADRIMAAHVILVVGVW